MNLIDGAIYALNSIINTRLPGTPWRDTYALLRDLEHYRDTEIRRNTPRDPNDCHRPIR